MKYRTREMGLGVRVCFVVLLAASLFGQSTATFQYFYDDLGQLTKVVDSTGTVIEYVYDPVGNILQIKRSSIALGSLAIFNFTPQRGGPGQTVTIQGQAFDPAPANDTVQFNGTAALVLSASATTLTVTVPAGATTGPISLTVTGQTVTTSLDFTVLPIPVITSLSRKSALLGASFPNAQFPPLTVTGINLTGSNFALAPATSPPAVTFGAPVIDPTGTSATMSLTVGTSATGTFAAVATNSAGSSSTIPTKANRFTIVDPRSTADSDGDGVPDAIEAIFGTDPLDANSFPILASASGQAESPAFTVLNRNAAQKQTTLQAESPAFVILNSNAGGTTKTFTSESPAFSVLNTNSQPGATRTLQAESPAFTVLNANSSGFKTTKFAESPAFTVKNTSATSGPQRLLVDSPAFSVLNGKPAPGVQSIDSPLFSVKNTFVASRRTQSPRTVQASLKAASPTSKKVRSTKTTSRSKVHKATRVSANSKIKPRTAISREAAVSEKPTTGSSDPQGVSHDNQHK